MPLLTNGLYRDDRYKIECEKKINYMDIINDTNIISDDDTIVTSNDNKNIIKSSNTGQICSNTENNGSIVYNHVSRVSDKYHKILK